MMKKDFIICTHLSQKHLPEAFIKLLYTLNTILLIDLDSLPAHTHAHTHSRTPTRTHCILYMKTILTCPKLLYIFFYLCISYSALDCFIFSIVARYLFFSNHVIFVLTQEWYEISCSTSSYNDFSSVLYWSCRSSMLVPQDIAQSCTIHYSLCYNPDKDLSDGHLFIY